MRKWHKKNLITLSIDVCAILSPERYTLLKETNKTEDLTLLLNHWINIRFFSQSSSMVLGNKEPTRTSSLTVRNNI